MASNTLPPVYDALLDYLVEKATPQEILAFAVSEDSQERAHDLMERNNMGILTAEEEGELQQILYVERLVDMLKSRALAALNK